MAVPLVVQGSIAEGTRDWNIVGNRSGPLCIAFRKMLAPFEKGYTTTKNVPTALSFCSFHDLNTIRNGVNLIIT